MFLNLTMTQGIIPSEGVILKPTNVLKPLTWLLYYIFVPNLYLRLKLPVESRHCLKDTATF